MDKPETHYSDDIAVIESFVISLYSVSCTLMDVNQAREKIFAQSSRTFEYLPPTKAALVEHIRRTTHQAGYVWGSPSSPSKCCLAQSSGVGSNLKPAGYHSGLPSNRAANAMNVLISCECSIKPVFHGECFGAVSAPTLYAPYPRRVRPLHNTLHGKRALGALEAVPDSRRVLCAQLDADAQDIAMGAPILLLRRLQTNNIAVMQHIQHNIILYCILL